MSKGYLTTHVLDTYNGKPGSGIKGSLFKIDGENKVKISNFILKRILYLENMSYYFFAGVILRNLQILMNHFFLMT